MNANISVSFYNSALKNKNNIFFLKQSFELRKQVYCDELSFEKSEHFETDIFDLFSAGAVISFDNIPVATARIVFNTDFTLPCLQHTKSKILEKFLNEHPNSCEISRFLISKNFRNTQQFQLKEYKYSSILLFLYLSIFSLCEFYDIKHMVFLCEKKLIKKLRAFGINVQLLENQPYFLHVDRFICFIEITDLIDVMNKQELIHLKKSISNGLDALKQKSMIQ